MKIRKTIIALGAMLLGCGLFAAPSAFAACTPQVFSTPVPPTNWQNFPSNGHMFWCGTSIQSTDASTIRNGANTSTGSGASTPAPQPRIRYQVSGNGGTAGVPTVDVYAWDSFANMKLYFNLPTLNPPPGTLAAGYTLKPGESSVHPGIAINVFVSDPLNHTFNQRVTNHEMGHAVDLILGSPSINSGSQFTSKLLLDINTINLLPTYLLFAPYGGLTPACQTAGSNYLRMQCKWGQNANDLRHLFANAYGARMPGGINEIELMQFMNNEFVNTRNYMDLLRKGTTAP